MKKLLSASLVIASLSACTDNADKDGDGKISHGERSSEMRHDSFIAMAPGRWETKFTFTEVDVPTLGNAEKRQLMDEVAKGASSISCLSAEEAKSPGADFFGGAGTEKCDYTKFDISGQNAKMALTCAMEGMGGSIDMDLDGSMGVEQFNFDTNVAMRLPVVGKVKLKGTLVGRHVGQCQAAN